MLIKNWKVGKFQLSWEGPYQVLLTIETAVQTAWKGWTHYTLVKGLVKQTLGEGEKYQWKVIESTEKPLNIILRKETH